MGGSLCSCHVCATKTEPGSTDRGQARGAYCGGMTAASVGTHGVRCCRCCPACCSPAAVAMKPSPRPTRRPPTRRRRRNLRAVGGPTRVRPRRGRRSPWRFASTPPARDGPRSRSTAGWPMVPRRSCTSWATYDNTEGMADVGVIGGGVIVAEDGQTVLVGHIAMQDGVMETYIIFKLGLAQAVESEASACCGGFYDHQEVRPARRRPSSSPPMNSSPRSPAWLRH